MNVEKILAEAKKLNNYVFALALKCEICGPQLRGYKGNYPKCKKHDISEYINQK